MTETAHRYNDASCQCRHCAAPVVALVNARFAALQLAPLTDDQIACMCDFARADEAWATLDNWEACGWIVGSERGEVAAFIARADMESQA